MKSMKKLIPGLLWSALAGCAVYFIIYGIRATGFLNFIPILQWWITSWSHLQIIMLSVLCSVICFATNTLKGKWMTTLVVIFLFVLIFNLENLLPGIFQPFHQMLGL
ncbi:hypothetical protein [Allobaculum mucilyticum]|uniref:hypothetical protein n=2 Tax=Allobaculum mucilyticum TaxID=2834459 RepID=UPI001F6083B2|nr:hypothetical protein [Allobaculum mucilyticum]UNT96440.1 hypothetical protein KWG62_01375 [Allobaculum mucilyticum]